MNSAANDNVQLRKTWADLCRVSAIFGVVLIHSCAATFYQYGKIPQLDWNTANLFDSLARCAVPLFVMISGALLLKPGAEAPAVLIIVRRVIKVLVPLSVWTVLYSLYGYYFYKTDINLSGVLTHPAKYHLWFVYMIIWTYLLLPAYQVLFNLVLSRKDMRLYLFSFWFIVMCVPVYWSAPASSLIRPIDFIGYGGYFIIGGVLASLKSGSVSARGWFVVYLAGAAATCLMTYIFTQNAHRVDETAYSYFAPNVLVSSFAAFMLFTRLRIAGRFAKVLQWISDRSFLIFFVHAAVLQRLEESGMMLYAGTRLQTVLYILILAVLAFGISLFISSVIRLVPKSKPVFG